jgi:hypothetical protein
LDSVRADTRPLRTLSLPVARLADSFICRPPHLRFESFLMMIPKVSMSANMTTQMKNAIFATATVA